VASRTDRANTIARRLDPTANSLNAIRLVLAATVIVSHSWSLGKYGRVPRHGGFAPGGWAVDAFFVLSGYLVTGSRLNNTLTAYLKRRSLRIYPGFVVCLLSVALVFAPIGYYHDHHTLRGYASTPHTPVAYVLANLGLKMRLPGIAGTPGGAQAWAGTLWTLYFEFLCYLLVGLLACWAVYRRRPGPAVAVFAVATAISLHNPHVVHLTDLANLVRLVPFFMAGSVVYLLRDRIACRWQLAVLSGITLVVLPYAGARYVVLCALPLTYLVLFLGAVLPLMIGRRNDISYGVYMYGYPVERIIGYAHLSSQVVYIAAALLITCPLAAASWFLVERPAMRWRARTTSTQPPATIGTQLDAVGAPAEVRTNPTIQSTSGS
jgi:peptidoglycan/LPS O-acetylase OafA/YrhL